MKTALLHYWLTNVRGGEKVLAALGESLLSFISYHVIPKSRTNSKRNVACEFAYPESVL